MVSQQLYYTRISGNSILSNLGYSYVNMVKRIKNEKNYWKSGKNVIGVFASIMVFYFTPFCLKGFDPSWQKFAFFSMFSTNDSTWSLFLNIQFTNIKYRYRLHFEPGNCFNRADCKSKSRSQNKIWGIFPLVPLRTSLTSFLCKPKIRILGV